MEDRNGLTLSPVGETLNAYYLAHINMANKSFSASAQATEYRNNTSASIGNYKDPRDAAYVAQQFQESYSPEIVRTMLHDNMFRDTVASFLEYTDIPKWKYPAEGLDMDDLTGDHKYTKNYAPNAREALVEAIAVYDIAPPPLTEVKSLIDKVEKLYRDEDLTYRQAAAKIAEGMKKFK
jgi:hypothetical protein